VGDFFTQEGIGRKKLSMLGIILVLSTASIPLNLTEINLNNRISAAQGLIKTDV
jgi:hypothetical protein